MSNEVLIIGGDHHNTLAMMRNFGKNKINFITLIHSSDITNKNEISINHSKYSKKLEIVDNNEEAILKWLLNNTLSNKQIIFPTSDLAQYTIDNNYNELKDYYVIPGFKDNPGKVVELMNKFHQKKWAEKNDILMAKSWNLKKKINKFDVPNDITFPCIIKPCISAMGNKGDIHISYDKNDFKLTIDKFNNSSYKELIVQEFIKKDFEICAIGCITPSYTCGQVIKKIRENPPYGGGSLTYAKFIDDIKINKSVNIVIEKLKNEKYQGLYDIEFLVCGEKIYLNEINFRHSGNGYALIKAGIPAPYILYLYFTNQEYTKYSNGKLIKFIEDFNEIKSLRKGYINIFIFIHDFISANAHSNFDIFDFGVFHYKLKSMIMKKVKKGKK